jgi:hypothetical protein
MLGNIFRNAFGKSGGTATSSALLDGNNSSFIAKRFVAIDELFLGGGKDAYSAYDDMKRYISDAVSKIRGKYVREADIEIDCHFLITTNRINFLPFEYKDRRFVIIPNKYSREQSREVFFKGSYAKQMEFVKTLEFMEADPELCKQFITWLKNEKYDELPELKPTVKYEDDYTKEAFKVALMASHRQTYGEYGLLIESYVKKEISEFITSEYIHTKTLFEKLENNKDNEIDREKVVRTLEFMGYSKEYNIDIEKGVVFYAKSSSALISKIDELMELLKEHSDDVKKELMDDFDNNTPKEPFNEPILSLKYFVKKGLDRDEVEGYLTTLGYKCIDEKKLRYCKNPNAPKVGKAKVIKDSEEFYDKYLIDFDDDDF